jgi:hypothetical protein
LLFTNYVKMFVALMGSKQCLPRRLIFQDDTNINVFLNMGKHQRLKHCTRNWFEPYDGLHGFLIFFNYEWRLNLESLFIGSFNNLVGGKFFNIYLKHIAIKLSSELILFILLDLTTWWALGSESVIYIWNTWQ